MSSLGEFLRERRAARALSQTEFALKVGASRQSVSDWEKGLVTPSAAACLRIADVLGVDATYLQILAGHNRTAKPLDAEEQELLLRAEEFKAGLRGIPRVFWGPVTKALTAAGTSLAEAALHAQREEPVTDPKQTGNRHRATDDDSLPAGYPLVPIAA